MLDHVFTSGGAVFGLAAFGAWLWRALRACPGLDVLVARHEDDMGLGAAASEPGMTDGVGGRLSRLAVSLTAIALLFTAVGYAIPD